MATHSSILAWKIPWKEESGKLQSMGSQSWTQLTNTLMQMKILVIISFNLIILRRKKKPGEEQGKGLNC